MTRIVAVCVSVLLLLVLSCGSSQPAPRPVPTDATPTATTVASRPRQGARARGGRRQRPVEVPAGERSSLEQAVPLAGASAAKPNIVLILTDDMAAPDLKAMPKVDALLAQHGTTFSSFFVTDSLCCPSRSSILRGQYVHNHHTYGNQPPAGGFQKFHATGDERSTIATWLKAGGYRTAMMGKYLNGYPATVSPEYVPPGWDEWDSPSRGGYGEFDYELNENGRLVQYGHAPEDFLVDVMARKSSAFIDQSVRTKQPFFLYLATFAPHQPATAAPRHAALFADAQAARGASFDETDVSDKPQFIRALPPLSAAQKTTIDSLHRKRLQSLQSVDDLVESLIRTLERDGVLNNTFLVFTSDNGFHLGQHRMVLGKQTAYDEDIHVPMIVRGPQVPAGATRDDLLMEIDLAPTFAEWGGLAAPSFVDGRSFASLIAGKATPWRSAALIEHYAGSTEPFASEFEQRQGRGARRIPTYAAIRTRDHTYVEYTTGERELYDLRSDPSELQNSYERADHAAIERLHAQLELLKKCSGPSCRSADVVP